MKKLIIGIVSLFLVINAAMIAVTYYEKHEDLPTKDILQKRGATSTVVQAKAAQEGQNPFLALVDATTPYLFANLNKAEAKVHADINQLFEAIQNRDENTSEQNAKQDTQKINIDALLTDLANAGVLPENPFYAIHGVELWPFVHLELTDEQGFKTWLANYARENNLTYQTRQIDGKEFYWVPGDEPEQTKDGQIKGGMAIYAQANRLSMTLVPDRERFFKRLVASSRPDAAYGAERFKAFNTKSGFVGVNSGFVDWQRVTALVQADTNGIFAYLFGGKNTAQACAQEYGVLAQYLPRLTTGFTQINNRQINMAVRQEIAQPWAGFAAAAARSGMTHSKSLKGALSVGLSMDASAAQKVMRRIGGNWSSNPPTCPSLQQAYASFTAGQQGLKNPMVNNFASNIQGLFVEIGAENAGGEVSAKDVNAVVALFMNNPKQLLAMGQGFVPALRQKQITAGGDPVLVSEGRDTPPDLTKLDVSAHRLWLALEKNALGASLGDEFVPHLESVLSGDRPDDVLLKVQWHYGRMLNFYEAAPKMMNKAKTGNKGEKIMQRMQALEAQEELYPLLAELYQSAAISMALTDKGAELRFNTKLNPR